MRAETGEGVDLVVRASGLGVLLASERAGRAVIAVVTRRALLEAPDLQVWGVVGAVVLSDSTLGSGLAAAQRDSSRHRMNRPSVLSRDLNLPYTQVCAYTGRSAVATVVEGRGLEKVTRPVSAGVWQLWRQTRSARRSLVERLQEAVESVEDRALLEAAVVSRAALEEGDGVAENGWVAVLHADGNGIGDIFANLRRAYGGDELLYRLSGVSDALESAAWAAVAQAILTVARRPASGAGWVLPILVGGDDITVLLDARHGFAFTTALVTVLERLLDQELVTSTLARVRQLQAETAGAVTAPQRVSVAAGLVFTKPHHPFSHSVSLAEELARSAKSVKRFEVGAVDVLVLHESAVRDLAAVRADLHTTGHDDQARLRLWAGPIVLGDPPPELAHRSVARLTEAIGLLASSAGPLARPDSVSGLAANAGAVASELVASGVVHELRQVLASALPDRSRLASVVERARVIAAERGYGPALDRLLEHLIVEDAEGPFSRLLTAMELVDVTSGTEAAADAAAGGVSS
ncbi:hypothetical protein [Nocardia abscessus]|uniref:hypothetical protein n=1 Tax=Nocardia abscessus TaxID=120957 RepID=UPI002455730E|nr:hypothetical protein [Nocardia abscessus]